MRYDFLRTDDGKYPMASLLSTRKAGRSGGGRGGKTRLALYLSALWVMSSSPHTTTRIAPWWAGLLGLQGTAKHEGAGARAIRDAWSELERRSFVSVARAQPGIRDVPEYTLLNETGDGSPYTQPTGQNSLYFRVPELTWTYSLLAQPELTGSALAMYLVALNFHARYKTDVLFFPTQTVKNEAGIGDTTRKRGLQILEDLQILERDLTTPPTPAPHAHRPRNMYRLNTQWKSTGLR